MTTQPARPTLEGFGEKPTQKPNGVSASESLDAVKKIARSQWTVVAIVVGVLTFLAAWNVQISLTQSDLDKEVASLEASTGVALPDPDRLNPEIAAAEAELARTQETFLAGFSDPQISRRLIDIGIEHGVVVNFTDIEPEKFAQVEGQTFPAKLVTLSVDGHIDDLIAYVTALEAGAIEGLEVQTTKIAGRDEAAYNVQINAAVYRQLLDRDDEEESVAE